MTNQPAPEKCQSCGSPKREEPYMYIGQRTIGGWVPPESYVECADPWHGVLPVEPQAQDKPCGHLFRGACVKAAAPAPGVPPQMWPAIIEEANRLRAVLDNKPQTLKIGIWLNAGSILNAYREGDLNFAEAVENLEKWKASSGVVPQGAEPNLRELAMKARAKRTAWLEKSGVPISQAFAEFAEAIGELINVCEAHAAASQAEPAAFAKQQLSEGYKVPSLEHENAELKAKIAIAELEHTIALRELQKAERERDQAREALRHLAFDCAYRPASCKQCSEIQYLMEHTAAVPPSEDAQIEITRKQIMESERRRKQGIQDNLAADYASGHMTGHGLGGQNPAPSEDAPRFADGPCDKHGDYDARYLRRPKCEEEIGTGAPEDAPATPQHEPVTPEDTWIRKKAAEENGADVAAGNVFQKEHGCLCVWDVSEQCPLHGRSEYLRDAEPAAQPAGKQAPTSGRCTLCGANRAQLNREATKFGVCTFIGCKDPLFDLNRERSESLLKKEGLE